MVNDLIRLSADGAGDVQVPLAFRVAYGKSFPGRHSNEIFSVAGLLLGLNSIIILFFKGRRLQFLWAFDGFYR